jgi:tRNA(Ile)-lysidine synthase
MYATVTGSGDNLEYVHIKAVLFLCEKNAGKSLNLPSGVIAERGYEELCLRKKDTENFEFLYDIEIEKALFIKELGKTVKVSVENTACFENDIINACIKTFDYDIVKDGIKIRNVKKGDKIYINSIGGHKKLSDYFTDNKISKSERRKIPLLACGSDILWIFDKKGITNDKFKNSSADKIIYVSVY